MLAKEFRTARLLLRPLQPRDADDVYAYASQPGWGDFLPIPVPYERHHADEFIAQCIQADWTKVACFALVLGEHVIGAADVRVLPASWANLGYSLAPMHWGKGLVVEAARPLITAVFQEGVARVEISAALPNHRSWRVAEKLGFRYEGTLRSRMLVRDKRYDAVYYGLLPSEWKG